MKFAFAEKEPLHLVLSVGFSIWNLFQRLRNLSYKLLPQPEVNLWLLGHAENF